MMIDRDALVSDLVSDWMQRGYEAPEVLIEATVDAVLARLDASELVDDPTTPGDVPQDRGATVRTYCALPEGALPVTVVEVCKYLDVDDGTEAISLRHTTDSRTGTLGLLEAAKLMVMGMWPE